MAAQVARMHSHSVFISFRAPPRRADAAAEQQKVHPLFRPFSRA